MSQATISRLQPSPFEDARRVAVRTLLMRSTPTDCTNFIVACLTHDIGYIRGIVKGDDADGYVVDDTGRKISLPRGSSDAALAPYHVER